jgi:soluble lytic murein transglycosylase
VQEALVRQAESLLALGRTESVRALLGNPPGFLPEVEVAWLLAEADWKDGKLAEAVEGYRKIYYLHPASDRAMDAGNRLSEAERRLGTAFTRPSIALREARADRLFEARQWGSARREYAPLAAMQAKKEAWVVRLGVSQFQARATWPSLETLGRLEVSDPELDAERLYTLAAAYRRIGRSQSMQEQVRALGEKHPKSNWYQEALFLAGNYYRAARDPKETPRSLEFYRKLFEAFPQGERAALAHWYVTWQAYRERRLAEAKTLFEAHVRTYPTSPQLSAALYWLGRMAETEAPLASAAYYQKLVETFPNYYYGLLGRERLAELPPEIVRIATPANAGFVQVARPGNGVVPANGPSPAEAAVLSRVKILESAWLMGWAMEELSDAVRNAPSPFWLGLELARLEKARGRHHVAMRYGKRHISGYFAMAVAEMPRESWEVLFPLLWWKELKSVAETTRLDPYLVAGLIRQESEFDPRARSRSNARGLMQLLPSTARYMSRRIPDRRTRSYTLVSLYSPEINVIYGTHYLREVLDQFSGTVEYALAGYNAGPHRVAQWTRSGGFGEPAEFVESIPITETREYVQAVLRNAAVYRMLYQPQEQAAGLGTANGPVALSTR